MNTNRIAAAGAFIVAGTLVLHASVAQQVGVGVLIFSGTT